MHVHTTLHASVHATLATGGFKINLNFSCTCIRSKTTPPAHKYYFIFTCVENGRSTSNAIDIDDDDGGTLQLREAANIVPVTPSPLVLPLSPPSHPLSSSSPESPTILISMSEKLHRKPHPHKLDLRKLSIPSSPSLDCITNNGGERERERERETKLPVCVCS